MLENLGLQQNRNGTPGLAIEYLERARKVFEEIGETYGMAWTAVVTGECLSLCGRFVEGAAEAVRGRAIFLELGDAYGAGMAGMDLGQALGAMGDSETAIACLEETAQALVAAGFLGFAAAVWAIEVLMCLEVDDVRRAHALLEEVIDIDLMVAEDDADAFVAISALALRHNDNEGAAVASRGGRCPRHDSLIHNPVATLTAEG